MNYKQLLGRKTYSFSKAKRFSKQSTNYVTANYDIGTQMGKKPMSFSKGPRSDFTKCTNNAPPPTKYRLQSAFDPTKQKGKTFGVSRENAKELCYITQSIQRHPGVGNYSFNNKVDSCIQYTMRPKTQSSWLPSFLQESSAEERPGPGEYENGEIVQMGQTMYSRFRSSRCHRMGKQERFMKIRNSIPGPNVYMIPDGMNDSGIYYESKHRGQGKRIISKEPRKSFIDQITQRQEKQENQPIVFNIELTNGNTKAYESEY